MNRLLLWALAGGFMACVFASAVDAKDDPDVNAACVMPAPLDRQSPTYPVRLTIRGDDAKMLGSGVVTVSRLDGSGVVSVDCAKPQVVMRLSPGSYIATVDAAGGPTRNIRFRVVPSQRAKILALRIPPSRPELTEPHEQLATNQAPKDHQ